MWTITLLLCCCLWAAEAQSDGSRRQNIWNEPITFQTKAKDVCTMIITGQGDLTKLRVSCQAARQRSYWCEYVGKPHTCRPYNKNPRHYFIQMMWGLRKLHNACQAPRRIHTHMCRRFSDEAQMVFSSASFPRSWPEESSRSRSAAPTRPEESSRSRSAAPTRPEESSRSRSAAPTRPEESSRSRPAAPTRPEESSRSRSRSAAPTRPEESSRSRSRPEEGQQLSTKAARVPPRAQPTQRSSIRPMTPAGESDARRLARLYCWRSLQGFCSFFIRLVRN